MPTDDWQLDALDLPAYLGRVGVAARPPGREALDELHEAHVRALTCDNIDVLLGAHTTDGLEVRPVDVLIGHHFTSTYPRRTSPRPCG